MLFNECIIHVSMLAQNRKEDHAKRVSQHN